MIKEACIGSYIEGVRAFRQGADRLELCENLTEGGTTPSYGTVKKLVEDVDIPVVVMIRPRGGDFVYSPAEIDIMVEDIRILRGLNIDGFVLGVLDRENRIDYPLLGRLVTECREHRVTFHKAVDEVSDPVDEVEKLAELGVSRILTSGGSSTALEGRSTLNQMIEAAGSRIEIISAGKITSDNIEEVSSEIRGREFHGKLIVGEISKD